MNLNEIKESLNRYEIDNEEQYYGLDKVDALSLIGIAKDLVAQVEQLERRKETVLKSHCMLERQVEEMQKALEWYADTDFYEWDGHDILRDRGERARKALQSLKEGSK